MQCAIAALAPQARVAPCAARQQQPSAALAAPCTPGSALRPKQQLAAQWQTVQQRRRSGGAGRIAASSTLNYGAEWTTPKDAYLTVGVAHCFAKGDDGKLVDQFVIEPITANSIECMAAGGATSFKHVFSLRLGEALERNKAAFPPEFAAASFCDDYEIRCDSCARTWMRPHALDNLLDVVPLGQLKSGFKYSTVDKRVLNVENVVNDDDNIKQDISIDVYGRKEGKEIAAVSKDPPAAAAAAEEEDDMDALLGV